MKRGTILLIAIFVFVVGLRLFFAFQSNNFSDDRAYFAYRQVEHITETGLPFYDDDLSYGGRTQVFLPLFYYALSFFALFMPITLVLKTIPNVFAASLIFIVYALVLHLTRNRNISVFTAALSSVIPIFVSQTVNSVSPYTLAAPLMFLLIYFFLKLDKGRYTTLYVTFFFVLTFTHASVVVLVLGFLFYLISARVERLKTSRAELEVTLFSVFLLMWSYFILFKKLFFSYGTAVFRQNIPAQLLSQYFQEITLLGVMNQIGFIPLFAGAYVLYKYLFRQKNRSIYVLTGFAIAVSLVLWLQLISFNGGLILFGMVLAILFGQFFKLALQYLSKTKLVKAKPYLIGIAIVLLVLTTLVPTVFYADREIKRGFSDKEIDALVWLNKNTNETDVVLGTLEEGHLISAVAQRPNVMDSNFLLIPNINQRLSDLRTIFSTSSEIEAVNVLTKYNVQYIYFSDRAKLRYKRTSLPYTDDANCFQLVYDKGVQVFRAKCKVETTT